jgi:hypothetical protein
MELWRSGHVSEVASCPPEFDPTQVLFEGYR